MFKFLYNIFRDLSDDQDLKQQAIQNKSKFYPSSTSSTGMRDTKTGESVIYADSFTGDVWIKSNYKEMARKQLAKEAAYFANSRAERENEEQRKRSLIKDLERCLGHSVIEPEVWLTVEEVTVTERGERVKYWQTPNNDGWCTGFGFDGSYKEYLRK